MEDQDPLATSSAWDIHIKVESQDPNDYSYLEEIDQHNAEQESENGLNIDFNNVNTLHTETSKTKRKTKKKNKKPSKPWKSNKLYPCPQCDYVGNRYNNLTAHMGKHSDIKNLFCDFCPYSTRYKTSLRRHVKYQHVLNNTVEDCPWCDFKTSFKCNLKTHIQRLHSCTECQFKGTEDEIMSHFNETHAGEEKAMAKYLQKRIRSNTKKMSRVECDNSQVKTEAKSDGSDKSVKDDDDESGVEDNIFAPECEIMEISNVANGEGDERNEQNGAESGDFSRKWNIKTTVKTVKKKAPIEENKFSCSECEFTTEKCEDFVQHMQSAHDATFEIDNTYKCRHCDYSSRFKHNVRLHETKHTGEKIYKCTLCDYGTSYNTVFQRHQRKHAQMLLGPFLCDKCTFKTNTQGRLQYHMQRCHQVVNDTAHKCDFCDFYTDIKWRLNKHVNKSQSDGEIVCEYCEFKSQFKCQMRMHRKEHLWSLGSSEKLKSLRKSSKLSGFYAEGPEVDNCGQQVNYSGQFADRCTPKAHKGGLLANSSGGQVANNDGQLVNNGQHWANNGEQVSKNEDLLANSGETLANNSGLLASICGKVAEEKHVTLTLDQTSEDCTHLAESCGQPTNNYRHPTQMNDQNHFSDDSNSQSNFSETNYTEPTEYQSPSMSTTVEVTQYDINQTKSDINNPQSDINHTQSDINDKQSDIPMSGNLFSYSCIEEQNKLLKNSYTIDEGAIQLNEVRVGFDRTQEKPYSCFQCVYTAKYKAAVQRHYLRHHSAHIRPYKCRYCGLQTTTRDAMWKHIKRSQLLEVVNCECNEFSTRYRCDLLQHKKCHNNFRCDLCSLSYKSRYDLERHILNHTSNSVFKCHSCNYCTEKEHLLLEHETFHTGARPFKCDVCSYSTVKELLLDLHRKKWHGHFFRVKKIDSQKNHVNVSSSSNVKVSTSSHVNASSSSHVNVSTSSKVNVSSTSIVNVSESNDFEDSADEDDICVGLLSKRLQSDPGTILRESV